MKSRLLKKLITYGFLPFMVVFFSVSPFLGFNIAHAAFNFWTNIGQGIGTIIANLLVGMNIILSGILYLISMLLDFAIQYSIAPNVDPETGLGSLYASETINTAWNLLRDIINMSFIFILLYIAIGTVLNIQNVNWKKQVSQIIIAAILVNFSLFITRVVVDAGNIVANGFYQELTVCEDPTECGGRDSVGISERFTNALGIAYLNELRNGTYPSGYKGWEGVGTALMQTVVILVSMWVFLAVSILFIARTFALVFILILSPIGIAGSSIPLLGSYAQKWRQELFKQSMLGVVFLFFTFIILLFASLEGDSILAGSAFTIGDVNEDLLPIRGAEDGPRAESLFIMYALVIAALIMSLRLTKNMSGQIGKFADGIGKAAVGATLGVATGGAALATRAAVGGRASRTLANEELKTKARGGNRIAQARLDTASWASKNSFDVRNSALGGIATKSLGKQGFNVSATQKMGKGGYEAGIEKNEKSGVEKSKRYAPSREYAEELAAQRNAPVNAEYEKRMGYAENLEKQALSMPEGDTLRERKLQTINEQRRKAKEYRDSNTTNRKRVALAEQEKFAASLEKDPWWKRARGAPVTGPTARNMDRRSIRRKRVADAIRKEFTKGDFDKLLDAVKESAKGDAKKEGDNE